MRPFPLLLVPVLLTGCLTTEAARRIASPQTGCREDQLEIEQLNEERRTWEAVGCGGRWLCGPFYAGNASGIICSAAASPTPAVQPIPAEPMPQPRRPRDADESSRKTVAAETGCALDSLRITQHLDDGDATLTRVEGCGPAWMCRVGKRAECRIAQGQNVSATAPEPRAAPAEPADAGPPAPTRKPLSH